MSIDKFRFVSPGVYTNEIDNSRLARAPEDMGPAIIGRSLRGPMMRPVKIDSYSDFVEVFGEPVPGGSGGDVWREGNKTAPTYAAYAAQAYLRSSGGVTFVRLGGFEHEQAVETGRAGWNLDNAYGLFVMPISKSSPTEDIYETDGNVEAHLAAVIYASGSSVGLSGNPLSGSSDPVTNQKGVWARAEGTQLQFRLVIDGKDKIVNFDKTSKKYIRSVLNTNPILVNDKISKTPETYFLGETYKTLLEEKFGDLSVGDYAAIVVKLKAGSVDFADFREGAKPAESGWIVSQHKGVPEDFQEDLNREYPVQKLFKFVGLSEGEWNSQNLKISIEDIKAPPNEYVKFGSFTVSVRSAQDNDLTPKYLERFVGVNLDPSSEDYIAKKIGDKRTEWDYEKKEFVEYGMFNNRSKFIRVEMDIDVDGGMTDKDLIPFGFYAPSILTSSYKHGDELTVIANGQIPFISGTIAGNSSFDVKFTLPEIPTLSSFSEGHSTSFQTTYFGAKTNVGKTKKYNEDYVDFVRSHPVGYNELSSAKPSYLFSLDDISGSMTSTSTIIRTQPVEWQQGNRMNGQSLTANNGVSHLLANFNRFTVPIFGGHDGVNIKEKDPFNRRVLNAGEETSNYAFNSVKIAIESIADPEVAEINLAAMPGIDNKDLTGLLIDKCEMRGDALAIIDLENDYTPDEGKPQADTKVSDRKPKVEDAINALVSRGLNSSYGCSFFPWVLVRDTKTNNTVWVPPSVVALGTFSSSQRNTELWFAPAGFNRGGLSDGAAGIPVIQTALRLNSKNRDDLYSANINPIATFPAEGIVIFGQKTLQVTPSALDRINVRRLMIYVKKEISRMAKVVLFDPNIQVTWNRFKNQAIPFLESVQSRFGLSDFRVILDSTTTTPDLVDRNIVYAKILLKPTRAIEFIALDFVIAPTGASFND